MQQEEWWGGPRGVRARLANQRQEDQRRGRQLRVQTDGQEAHTLKKRRQGKYKDRRIK